MNRINLNHLKVACVGIVMLFTTNCSLDPVWYSEATPETFFTSKESVYSFFIPSVHPFCLVCAGRPLATTGNGCRCLLPAYPRPALV